VPQVRQSVPGPNKTGEAHHSFLLINPLKAIETYHFSAHVRWGERGAPVQFLMGSVRKLSPAELSSRRPWSEETQMPELPPQVAGVDRRASGVHYRGSP
jgi:hypothetical protein